MDNVIEITNLRKEYKDFTLNDISFNVPKGSIMGFIGENGAGKTTTIKLILNIIKKDKGSIKVFGLDNEKEDIKIKENIGVSLDELHFYEGTTIKNIGTILKNIFKNWDQELFLSYINKFNLPIDKTIKQLSKGMKMKLSILAAMCHKPDLLILDEPTSGLDPAMRTEILDIFQEFIQDENHSILLSSHITSDLEKIADYITFIHNGNIVFSKSKDDIFDNFGILKCNYTEFDSIDKDYIVNYRKNEFGYEVLITDSEKLKLKYKDYIIDKASIEDIMLLYIKGDK